MHLGQTKGSLNYPAIEKESSTTTYDPTKKANNYYKFEHRETYHLELPANRW